MVGVNGDRGIGDQLSLATPHRLALVYLVSGDFCSDILEVAVVEGWKAC